MDWLDTVQDVIGYTEAHITDKMSAYDIAN